MSRNQSLSSQPCSSHSPRFTEVGRRCCISHALAFWLRILTVRRFSNRIPIVALSCAGEEPPLVRFQSARVFLHRYGLDEIFSLQK